MNSKGNVTKTIVDVKCDGCGEIFQRTQFLLNLYARNNKTKGKFCSRQCAVKFTSTQLHWEKPFSEEISSFHEMYRRAQSRTSKTKKEMNLSIEHLLETWLKQEGKCFYTKIPLELPKRDGPNLSRIYGASLDRIDSNIGYVDGNVQFVSMAINYMKGTMSHEDTIKLINLIKNNGLE